MTSGILAEPILVGREKELEELKRCLAQASSGKGVTVFISGEAGAGKTRLTTEFLNIVKKKQVTVLSGWCLSNVAVPYFPFMEAFDSYISSNEHYGGTIANQQLSMKSWLIKNQSEANETLGNTSPLVWKDQVFVAIAKELLFLSTKKPLILVMEDLHWADSASLSLLHYLARQAVSERILIIATFRSEGLNVNIEGHPNPLSKELLLMGREDLYREVKLSSLSQDDVRRIAENMLGGLVLSDFGEKLATDTMGNPLFVVESLRMMHQQGRLIKTNGKWSLRVDNFEIPKKIKDVMLLRLESLKSDQRIVLDAASVVGEKFDPKLIAAAVLQDYASVLRALNETAKTTLIIHCDENCCRFSHEKSREMLYEEIPPLLRKEYHSRIAEKIEAGIYEANGFSIDDLAFHYAQAGNKEKAVKYSFLAGRDALLRWSNEEAIKHFTYILGSLAGNTKNAENRRKAWEGLGDAYYANSMFKEAIRTFEELGKNETGITKLRALRKAMESAFQCMDIPQLMELINKAEPYFECDRLENARVLINRGRVSFFGQGNVKLALEDMANALRIFEEEHSYWDFALALVGVGMYHSLLGNSYEGIAESLRAIVLFEELGDFRFQMEAYWPAGENFCNLGLNQEALGMFAKVIEIDEKLKMGEYNRLVYANAFSARPYELMGDWEKALSYCLKALEASKKTDNLIAPGIVYTNLSRIYSRLGDLKHAEEYFDKFVKLPAEVQKNVFVEGALSKAVFFTGKSEWKDANRCFKERLFDEVVMPTIPTPIGAEIYGKTFYVWALEKEGRFEEARVQSEELQNAVQEIEQRFAHVNLQTHLMVRKEVMVGEELEMRLDLVNASRKPGVFIKVEGIIPSDGFKVTALSPNFDFKNFCIETKNKEIGAFQVVTVKLTLQALKAGVFNSNPKVVYLDELGKTKTSTIIPVKIHVEPVSSAINGEMVTSVIFDRFEFKSEVAQKAFDCLVRAFVEDYMQRRIAQEKAGWRSLMNIINEGRLSRSSMYGYGGRRGKALIELESRGLVEARFFPGERGRGGKILKLRVAYEKETIKRIIDNRIMNKKNRGFQL